MPNSYPMQRTKNRSLFLADKIQSDASVSLPDAAFTRAELMETSNFAQITPKKESDYEYAGKGHSFATDISTIELDGSFEWGGASMSGT